MYITGSRITFKEIMANRKNYVVREIWYGGGEYSYHSYEAGAFRHAVLDKVTSPVLSEPGVYVEKTHPYLSEEYYTCFFNHRSNRWIILQKSSGDIEIDCEVDESKKWCYMCFNHLRIYGDISPDEMDSTCWSQGVIKHAAAFEVHSDAAYEHLFEAKKPVVRETAIFWQNMLTESANIEAPLSTRTEFEGNSLTHTFTSDKTSCAENAIAVEDIKFRGKSLKDDQWIYGSMIKSTHSYGDVREHPVYSIQAFDEVVDYGSDTAVDVTTLEQFTGCYDILGQEIYCKLRQKT